MKSTLVNVLERSSAGTKTSMLLLQDAATKLRQCCQNELAHDPTVNEDLSRYVPPQGADTFIFPQKLETVNFYNLHERILNFLDSQQPNPVLLLQGAVGTGKTLCGRYLEAFLWNKYHHNSDPIPLFISLPTFYQKHINIFAEENMNMNMNMNIIQRTLQDKGMDEPVINMLREKATFVIFLDGFDHVKTLYDNQNVHSQSNFYERFQLHK